MSNNTWSKLDDALHKIGNTASGGSTPLGKKIGLNSDAHVEKMNLTSREYGKYAMYKDGGKVSKKSQPKAPKGGLNKMGKCC